MLLLPVASRPQFTSYLHCVGASGAEVSGPELPSELQAAQTPTQNIIAIMGCAQAVSCGTSSRMCFGVHHSG